MAKIDTPLMFVSNDSPHSSFLRSIVMVRRPMRRSQTSTVSPSAISSARTVYSG